MLPLRSPVLPDPFDALHRAFVGQFSCAYQHPSARLFLSFLKHHREGFLRFDSAEAY